MPLSNATVTDQTIANDIASFRGKVKQLVDVNHEEAEALLEKLRLHSRKLKGSPTISKQLLGQLWLLIHSLEAEAPEMGSKELVALRYARDFQRLFGLLLDDECDLDLPPPGRPRAR